MSAKVHHRTVRIQNVEVFYREAGSPEAPAVLLLHGFGTSSYMFRELMPALAGEYRLVAPDLPGFGHTDVLSAAFEYTFDHLASIIDAFTQATGLARRIAQRIGRALERSGLIRRDIENAYLAFDPGDEAPINGLLRASITYRIATGPREGQKVFTLRRLPAESEALRREIAESSGFLLHGGIAAKSSQRDKLEHLARYVARPPVASERLSLTAGGNVRLALKRPYRDGTTQVMFEPEDFIARLAALVPKPRAHT